MALHNLSDDYVEKLSKRAQDKKQSIKRGLVQVLSIFRYVALDTINKYVDETPNEAQPDIFDLVISDGFYKMKVMLSMNLNYKVYLGELRENSIIQINSGQIHYHDKLQPPYIFHLKQIEVVQNISTLVHYTFNEPIEYKLKNHKENEFIPITGLRKLYMCPNTDSFLISDPRWAVGKIGFKNTYSRSNSLKDAISNRTRPSIIGRIVLKSRLNFYYDSKKPNGFPCRFHFRIVDNSGAVDVTVWGAACAKYYFDLVLDDIVCIKYYKKKTSQFQNFELSIPNQIPRGAELLDTQIDVNCSKNKDEQEIVIVNNGVAERELPRRRYNFLDFPDLPNCPDDTVIDIAGIIYYVGRLEVESVKNKRSGNDDYVSFRWVALKNHYGDTVNVKFYNSTNPKVMKFLECGKVLLCADLKINKPYESDQKNLHTTQASQLFVHNGCGIDDSFPDGIEECDTLIYFMNSNQPEEFNFSMEGHYPFPFISRSTETRKKLKLTSMYELLDEVKLLKYQQRKRFYVQGDIYAFQYIFTADVPTRLTESDLNTPIRKKRTADDALDQLKTTGFQLHFQVSPVEETDILSSLKTCTSSCWPRVYGGNVVSRKKRKYWIVNLTDIKHSMTLESLVLPLSAELNANDDTVHKNYLEYPYSSLLDVIPFSMNDDVKHRLRNIKEDSIRKPVEENRAEKPRIDDEIGIGSYERRFIFCLDCFRTGPRDDEVETVMAGAWPSGV